MTKTIFEKVSITGIMRYLAWKQDEIFKDDFYMRDIVVFFKFRKILGLLRNDTIKERKLPYLFRLTTINYQKMFHKVYKYALSHSLTEVGNLKLDVRTMKRSRFFVKVTSSCLNGILIWKPFYMCKYVVWGQCKIFV